MIKPLRYWMISLALCLGIVALSACGSDTSSSEQNGEEGRACLDDEDCDDELRCVRHAAGEEMGVCAIPVADRDEGEACEDSEECQSGLCHDDECAFSCVDDTDCPDDRSCDRDEGICHGGDQPDPDPEHDLCAHDNDCPTDERCALTEEDDQLFFACQETDPMGAEGGDACDDDADCASNLCRNESCVAPCDDQEACDPYAGTLCLEVEVERDDARGDVDVCEPSQSCHSSESCDDDDTCSVLRAPASVETVCQDPGDRSGAQGDACDEDADCASNLCFEGRFGSYCANPCDDDSYCDAYADSLDLHCETRSIDHDTGSQDVDICVRDTPEACDRDADCTDDQVCAVVADQQEDVVTTRCLPEPPDASAETFPCSDDDDCQHGLCHEGMCSNPCSSYQDCDTDLICDEQTVSKDGLSGDVQFCQNLGFQSCSSPGDCAAQNTTCNLPTFDADDQVDGAACGMTNPGQAGLGEECTELGECESAYCWVSDDQQTGECSVFCDQHGDCASAQHCIARGGGLSACLAECTTSADCDGGNVCKLGTDPAENAIYSYCGNTLGDDTTGDECSSTSQCDNGICLAITHYETIDISCTEDSDCDSGYECTCPPGDDNCSDNLCVSTGAQTVQRCSELCDASNGDADCQSDAHDLEVCRDTIEVTWDSVQDTISACTLPFDD